MPDKKNNKKVGGLGRGLEALFGNNILIEDVEETKIMDSFEGKNIYIPEGSSEETEKTEVELELEKMDKIKEVNRKNAEEKLGGTVSFVGITEIEPNKHQPRKNFDEEAIQALSVSIKNYGILQPIVVEKKENYYEIIAGERRWRAAKLAGLKEMPVIIKEVDEKTKKEIALIENVQREDLNPIERAKGYKELMLRYGLTQEKVGEIIGKTRSSVANTIRILNLDPRVIEMAEQGLLSEGHCKALMSTDDAEKQYNMALYVVETGASVREAERRMAVNKKQKKVNKDNKYDAVYRDIEDSFRGFFGTKVKLNPGVNKGKIVLEYSSNEDLERILELIKR